MSVDVIEAVSSDVISLVHNQNFKSGSFAGLLSDYTAGKSGANH
jgi:hypothetical protein